ncbi:hypothetical protein Clacol_001516 [Clathrus columnatus]|uniref:Uncharacterized protein n=1 Tax=Clathrus columnatus TaxID=1419009 RepID=A0AAV5A5Y8_9AGAM|nr:hypothetical protein Clacol_001516 [Clathrus columnatus]
MYSFKRICGLLINNPDLYDARISHVEETTGRLEKSLVPVTCANPCEYGHPDYPNSFSIDLTSEMLGSVKPYQRQVIISTGKSDWEREIADEEGSLAMHLSSASKHYRRPPGSHGATSRTKKQDVRNPPGLFTSSEQSRLSILNGSHTSLSCNDVEESVLVLPDYKVVKEVPRSQEGSEMLWRNVLEPTLNRAGKRDGVLKSYPLQYACVILLCSHKRRDNRCHIAAPKLQIALTEALENEGYEVYTDLEEPFGQQAIEDYPGTDEERELEFLNQLQAIADSTDPKKVLILKTSHIGGHKYSGNVVIYTPQGSGVWYGRVSPHEVPAIVKTTICDGKVLPALLRGGVNLSRPKGQESLLSCSTLQHPFYTCSLV